MRGIRSVDPAVTAEAFPSVEALPPDAVSLFADADSLFSTSAWWRTVMAVCMPAGAEARFALCRRSGTPVGLFPLLHAPDTGWTGFTTPYTCRYTPLIAPG